MEGVELQLIGAAKDGDAKQIKALVKGGCDVNSKNGYSALMWATVFGHLDAVRELLKSKPRLDDKGDNEATALMLAAKYDRPEIAKLLLKAGAAPELRDAEENTASDIARSAGNVELADMIERWPSPGPWLQKNKANGSDPVLNR